MGRVKSNQEFYIHFIEHCNNVKDESFSEIHSCIEKVHYLYSEIIKHSNILRIYNIKVYNPIYDIKYIDLTTNKDIKKLDISILRLLRLYNYIAFKKIETLTERFKLYDLFSNIDKATYDRLQYQVNHNNVNHIVKGGTYCFGGRIGAISIIRTTRRNTNVLNIAETARTRKAILDANLVPQSIENPNGVPCIVSHKEGELYYKWNFNRHKDVLVTFKHEYNYHSNRTSHWVNNSLNLTKQEVYDSSIAGIIKMFILMQLDPHYADRYPIVNRKK